jgi:cytidylate kinase
MIIVMNRKSGVGSTTIAYNLSRLLDLPLHVQDSSFLHKINKEYKEQ